MGNTYMMSYRGNLHEWILDIMVVMENGKYVMKPSDKIKTGNYKVERIEDDKIISIWTGKEDKKLGKLGIYRLEFTDSEFSVAVYEKLRGKLAYRQHHLGDKEEQGVIWVRCKGKGLNIGDVLSADMLRIGQIGTVREGRLEKRFMLKEHEEDLLNDIYTDVLIETYKLYKMQEAIMKTLIVL